MPQAPRTDARHSSSDANKSETQRMSEKEAKRSRGAMSCAECRRLKLKCDKTVPCSSCIRRGCAQICPNGSLITGQGTRFVLADTERLHEKITQMSDRIRRLEDCVAVLAGGSHPLLNPDLMKIKSIIELHAAAATDSKEDVKSEALDDESQYLDRFGGLIIHEHGTTWYGRSAGHESLLAEESGTEPGPEPGMQRSVDRLHLPPVIKDAAAGFIMGNRQGNIDISYLIHRLPERSEALRLVSMYLDTAPWFFGAVTKAELLEEIMPTWYPDDGSFPSADAAPSRSAHNLALFFMVFCFGAMSDTSLPPPPENPDCIDYSTLARAALALEPILDRPPSVSTVQTLALMGIYQGIEGESNAIESTWILMGMATKAAQSIGLHHDSARHKLAPAEVQKRRALFWELFITDCWQSLATGRLPTFPKDFVDCELPADPDEKISEEGIPIPSFPAWKAKFGANCVANIVDGILKSKAAKYSLIIQLDRRVRDVPVPTTVMPSASASMAEQCAFFMSHCYHCYSLIYVHRCFFAQAIETHPEDPMKSPYAPSFLAGYRAACDVIESMGSLFSKFPAQIARLWVVWTHGFSASIMLMFIVTRACGKGLRSKLTEAAFVQATKAVDLFETAATYGGRAKKVLPRLQGLMNKATNVYNSASVAKPDIFANTDHDAPKDEFAIFSGQTHTVSATKRKTPSGTPSASTDTANPSPKHSQSPEMHPALAAELDDFQRLLNSQVNDKNVNPMSSFSRPSELSPASSLSSSDYNYGGPSPYTPVSPEGSPSMPSSYGQAYNSSPASATSTTYLPASQTNHHMSSGYDRQTFEALYAGPTEHHYSQYQHQQLQQHQQHQQHQFEQLHTAPHHWRPDLPMPGPDLGTQYHQQPPQHRYQSVQYRAHPHNPVPAPNMVNVHDWQRTVYTQGVSQHPPGLQETWSSFNYHVGGPMPFTS